MRTVPRLARKSAKIAAVFTAFTVALAALEGAFFPASRAFPGLDLTSLLLFVVVIGVVMFPMAFVLSFALEWGRERWRARRAPAQPLPPEGPVEPFRFEGRRWKSSVAGLALFLGFTALVWLAPRTGDPVLDGPMPILRWVALALLVVFVPLMVAFGFRVESFEADPLGIRIRRRFRAFDVRWDAVARVEVARLPSPPLHSWVSGPEDEPMPLMFGLWRKDGTFGGVTVPRAELGRSLGRRLERSLRGYAERNGLTIVEVPWRATRAWRRLRPTVV